MASQPNPIAVQANSLGLAAMRNGQFAEAKAHYQKAIAADPNAAGLRLNLAHACRELADIAGERDALEAALNIDRTDINALIRLAQLFERTGDSRNAMIRWSAFLQLLDSHGQTPPQLHDLKAHAEAYTKEQAERLSQSVYGGLEDTLAGLHPTERRRADAFIGHSTGARRIYQNECAGLHYPFLPADEFFDDFHFPWFSDLEAAAPAIRSELEALLANPGAALRPYVQMDEGVPDSKWSVLDNQLDWGACFLWEYGRPNEAVLERCPVTAATLAAIPSARIPGRAPSAFFSILKPHTHIPPHTGVSNTRAIIHLPLIVPSDCAFRVGGETRAWQEGKPFAFDDTIDHEAWNNSDQTRAILIFDVWNPHLTPQEHKIIAEYYAIADAAL